MLVFDFLTDARNIFSKCCLLFLKGNTAHPAKPEKPFADGDPRLKFCVKLDPRIHFALVCGAKVRLVFHWSISSSFLNALLSCSLAVLSGHQRVH